MTRPGTSGGTGAGSWSDGVFRRNGGRVGGAHLYRGDPSHLTPDERGVLATQAGTQ